MPQRVDQAGPGRREVSGSGMVGELPINPPDDVATGNVPDEQEQAVRGLVQPAVPERMPGQGAIGEFVRFGAGLETFVVPAAGKRPIPLELVAPGVGGEGSFDFRPRHVPVPIHIPLGHGIGDSLKAEHPHQPIEDHGSVMVFNCSTEATVDCVIPQIVDPGNLASNATDPSNNGSGMPHALGFTRNGDPAWHVRLTPPTGVGRRYRHRCRPGLSELICDPRAAERRVTIHRLYERDGQPG